MFQNDAYRSPLRKYRQPPGAMPTLACSAAMFGWCWAYCALPCGHHAAIPLDAAIDRLSAEATTADLCGRLVCTVCGQRKATLRMPSWTDTKRGWALLPDDKIAAGFRSLSCEGSGTASELR